MGFYGDTRTTKGDSFEGVPDVLGGWRAANNLEYCTWDYVRESDRAYVVRHHFTDIIVTHKDGTTELDTGGWRSKTTRERIERHSPYRIWTDDGDWFLMDAGGDMCPFDDGMVMPRDMEVSNAQKAETRETMLDEMAPLKNVEKLVRQYMRMFKGGYVRQKDKATAGDCMFCLVGHHHVPHTEQHIREGILTQSIHDRAKEYNMTKSDGSRTTTNPSTLRHYLIHAIKLERKGEQHGQEGQ